ncbi:MAG TPA: ABC transporter permease [Pyrinomonadaceae bacterium]|nr:ABC transporter permease [Pyrinomonadaceae bacterium]
MQNLLQDIRYALRSLIKRPGFVAVAIVTLAFGIGANTAIFSVVDAVLLSPLSFPEPERIVVVEGTNFNLGITEGGATSVPDFSDWQNQSSSFEQIAAFAAGGVVLTTNDEPERVRGTSVTADFFPLFRTSPLKGRFFQADEFKEGNDYVAMLSYALWQRRFGGSDSVIGSKVQMSNYSVTIVGVMPRGFDYPTQTEMWFPYPVDPAKEKRFNRFLTVVGRLKPGVTIQQAQSEMGLMSERLAQSYVETNRGWNVKLTKLHDRLVGNLRASLLILLGAVALVLLIACANVANLQLARATYRKREIAVRTALGASRLRIVRQLLTESLLLSIVSGAVGLALSIWLTRLLVSISPPNSPRFEEIGMDFRVFGFAFAVTFITGVVFGLVPAIQTSKIDFNETLKESGRSGSQARRNRIGSALMVSEIALSFMLLVGAGLLIKSFIHLREVNPGFNPSNMLTMRLSLPAGKYQQGEPRLQVFRQVVERISSLPGVTSAGAVSQLPLRGDTFNLGRGYLREGDPQTSEAAGSANFLTVTPTYFDTMQIPVKAGRGFTALDTNDAPKVMIVNETLARKLWPGESPVGRKIWVWYDEKFFREIVGVVGDTRLSLDAEAESQMYVPLAQDSGWGTLSFVVRTNGEPAALTGAVRNEIRAVDKGVLIYNVKTLDDVVAIAAAPRRTPMLLLSSFAGVAMLLAMLGIYGVTAYYVTQRTHEIGVRIALGARMRDVLKLVLSRGVIFALIGIAIGFAGAFGLTRYLSTLLFGVQPVDLMTFLSVAVILIVVALLACVIPARKAAKVDPLIALRYD